MFSTFNLVLNGTGIDLITCTVLQYLKSYEIKLQVRWKITSIYSLVFRNYSRLSWWDLMQKVPAIAERCVHMFWVLDVTSACWCSHCSVTFYPQPSSLEDWKAWPSWDFLHLHAGGFHQNYAKILVSIVPTQNVGRSEFDVCPHYGSVASFLKSFKVCEWYCTKTKKY